MFPILVFFALAMCSRAWHENGHYTIAYIAYEELSQTEPEVIDWVLTLLEPLQQECGEENYPFIECASWADKARVAEWRLLMYHHFISIPWFDEKAKPQTFFLPKFANVTYGIEETTRHLKSSEEDAFGSSKSIFGKGISIRMLMHFVGDVHQPLHASDRITVSRPEGDAGGNLFPIKNFNEKQMDNLHYLWDTMFEDPKSNIKGPINQSGYNLIKNLAGDIKKQHSRKSLQSTMDENPDPLSWAMESNEIAQSFVYKNIQENDWIPKKYLDQGRKICRRRIALAGYRLADKLREIHSQLNPKTKARVS